MAIITNTVCAIRWRFGVLRSIRTSLHENSRKNRRKTSTQRAVGFAKIDHLKNGISTEVEMLKGEVRRNLSPSAESFPTVRLKPLRFVFDIHFNNNISIIFLLQSCQSRTCGIRD
eukprot:TRINITY_DN6106_c0_g1_i2.p1 TRINITY_DN6106_c0_g1~~TRINITY_DN6106_c0_g1_i2.p1  ORF type:complete len:115 (+),score=17.50 TRINITY_DN6106_c0_g1_i2:286-630(+)